MRGPPTITNQRQIFPSKLNFWRRFCVALFPSPILSSLKRETEKERDCIYFTSDRQQAATSLIFLSGRVSFSAISFFPIASTFVNCYVDMYPTRIDLYMICHGIIMRVYAIIVPNFYDVLLLTPKGPWGKKLCVSLYLWHFSNFYPLYVCRNGVTSVNRNSHNNSESFGLSFNPYIINVECKYT